jgi:hypothetical protein
LEWSPVCCRRSPQWFLTPAPHHLKGIRAFDEPEDIRIIGDTEPGDNVLAT